MFGTLGSMKTNPMSAYKMGNRNSGVSSFDSNIVSSQHDYFFIPTTQRQIII
ncbi:hypothetical protein KO500_14905 [Cellulophaga baltica]|uniref:hypothetical protein n=1 Tax=Cellulophaga TaxID=104264 RepID=UPI001C07E185|nr:MULTISPECIES: hypothetical protein [Cellulophaga]MBU2997737.1 hypothetical protein [Cellulophaga baltica]MDO6769133.1 hypothetical protein [Cellulophaga sp. 1_MG-2023]